MSFGYARPAALRSIEWLAENLYDTRLRILDGSFHLPGSGRDPRAEYATGHIPGAVFFDIDDVCDPASRLPHMLPPPNIFVEKVQALGIGDGDHIIVYDQPGSCAATRVWWTFRAFGHHEVGVLDGGLAKWLAAGLPVTDQPPRPRQASLTARFDPSLVRSAADVLSSALFARFRSRKQSDPPGMCSRRWAIPAYRSSTTGRPAAMPAAIRNLARRGGLGMSRAAAICHSRRSSMPGGTASGGRPTNCRHCSRKQASISRSRS